MVSRTYRCLACLEGTVERGFDVSHLQVTCQACGEFSRFVHEGVYEQFQAFEEDPPADLDWGHLGKMEKFVVAEKMVREGKTVDDFDVERHADDDSIDDPSTADDAATTDDTAAADDTTLDSPEGSAGDDSTADGTADDH